MAEKRRSAPRDLIWDPRKMIHGPFSTCPHCGMDGLGTLTVSNDWWTRRCRECMHDIREHLPPLAKRIVYLDQMVLSNIAKELDPVWRGTRRAQGGPFWLQLFEQLERLVKLQLVVCPASPIHERESLVTPYAAILERLRDYLSAGTEFDFEVRIHARQLHSVLEAALEIRPLARWAGDARSVITGRIDEWMDHLQIKVNFGGDPDKPNRLRVARASTDEAFETLWRRWRQEKPLFAKVYEAELGGLYHAWHQFYRDYLTRSADVFARAIAIDEEFWNPRLEISVMQGLIRPFLETGDDLSAAHQHVAAFLDGDAARSVPANAISAALMAALARKAAAGQKRVPRGGTWNDVKSIATYIPYSDAIFVDDQFAGLLREEPLRSQMASYRGNVFSNRTRSEFLDWLRDIERNADIEHIAKVHQVYGADWLISYRTILEDERTKHSRPPS
jgi:hypothetical protein